MPQTFTVNVIKDPLTRNTQCTRVNVLFSGVNLTLHVHGTYNNI